jgi:RNA polymerase sigma factor (sigma-70 family)
MKALEHRSPGDTPRRSVSVDAADVEAEMAQAIEQGDLKRALTLIDHTYGAALYGHIRQIVGNDGLADDVFQITLVQAYRDLGTFSGRSSLRTWLYSIARHRALDALKAERRRLKRFAPADEAPDAADATPGAEQRMTDAELVAALEECVQKLAPHVRMAVLLRYQESFSYDDMARICREQPATLRARVSRALPLLRRCIEGRGTP